MVYQCSDPDLQPEVRAQNSPCKADARQGTILYGDRCDHNSPWNLLHLGKPSPFRKKIQFVILF